VRVQEEKRGGAGRRSPEIFTSEAQAMILGRPILV